MEPPAKAMLRTRSPGWGSHAAPGDPGKDSGRGKEGAKKAFRRTKKVVAEHL